MSYLLMLHYIVITKLVKNIKIIISHGKDINNFNIMWQNYHTVKISHGKNIKRRAKIFFNFHIHLLLPIF